MKIKIFTSNYRYDESSLFKYGVSVYDQPFLVFLYGIDSSEFRLNKTGKRTMYYNDFKLYLTKKCFA